jgi:hypothetical protein
VTGVLKGYDQLLNLVLDEVEEQVQGNDVYTVSHVLSEPVISRSRTAHTHTRPRCAPRAHNNTAQPCRRARGDLKSIHRTRLAPLHPSRIDDGTHAPLVLLRPLPFFSCFLDVINERCNLILDHARSCALIYFDHDDARARI